MQWAGSGTDKDSVRMVIDEDSDEETVGPVCRIAKRSIHVVPLSSKRQIHFAIAVATGDSLY
jgi:hypothetical protein